MARKQKVKFRRRLTRRRPHKASRTAARRPKKVSKSRINAARRSKVDPRLEAAIREMNRGRSLTAAARLLGIPAKTLQGQLRRRGFLKRRGKRWVIKDNRTRRVQVITDGRVRSITVAGYAEAEVAGEHYAMAGKFVQTNDLKLIKPFNGISVRAVDGSEYVLETDPNALHRLAAMDSPPFHEIYEITSNS